MPFVWDMARYCLELPYGRLLHFPAGNYYAQMEHWTGKAELSLMKVAHASWYTFGHLKREKWTAEDLAYFDWLRKEPKVEPLPDRRFDEFIGELWRVSNWAFMNLEKLRRDQPN